MKTILTLLIMVTGQQVLAFEKEDSRLDLRAALMQSNKDYNEHKGVELTQDNERIADWNHSDTQAITIEASIDVEARNFKIDAEATGKQGLAESPNEKVSEPSVNATHEISMNN